MKKTIAVIALHGLWSIAVHAETNLVQSAYSLGKPKAVQVNHWRTNGKSNGLREGIQRGAHSRGRPTAVRGQSLLEDSRR